MADRMLLAAKLQKLRGPIQQFFSQGPVAMRSGDFDNWRDDVIRWLRLGDDFTKHELDRFNGIDFDVPGQTVYPEFDRLPEVIIHFHKELKVADGTIGRAIENLEGGISPVQEKRETPTAVPLVNVHNEIANSNVLNLNVSQVLEAIACEIEKKDPAEGGRFRDWLRRMAENPVFQAILKGGIDAVLRHYGAGESGRTVSV
jgi:hypothetical protein